jgi:hypothetical protein
MKNIQLAFFDMDGCLMDTPHPEVGKKQWAEHYGKEYPAQGWWGRLESMDLDVFNIKPKNEVLNYYKELYSKNVICRILTSRLPKFEPLIKSLLIDNDIDMEEILTMKPPYTKGERIVHTVAKYTLQGYIVTDIYFFDDRNKEIVTVEAVRSQIEKLGIRLHITKIQSDAND